MNKQVYELSKIVMPTSEYLNFQDLFLRKEEKTLYFAEQLQKVNVYKFNTWMNLFAAKKYYHYCDLGKIYLKLDIEGTYQVNVVGSNRSVAFPLVEENIVSVESNGPTSIEIPNADKYEAIYFEIVESVATPVKFNCAAWCTEKGPQRDNKLAIVSCTFKREDFVTKNIRKFEQFKKENPNLQDKIYMFISDNGKTLPETLNSENITIYPNMNAGGAGGFTRGLMEVMKLNKGFNRVLFMDDDVEMFPESFYRTLLLSNYLKTEYSESIINGAMLDLYDKAKFVESLAVQTTNWVKPYHKGCNLYHYESILDTNEFSAEMFDKNSKQKVSSAWWYCSFAIKTFEEKGLPISLFFRCDDLEYSWRNQGLHHIQMNGICVWHAPFEWRVSKVVDFYYSKRNFFLINILHTKDYKKNLLKQLKKDFKWIIDTYDYIGCEIYLRAIKDLLNGPNTYKLNPEVQFKEINEINKKSEYVECDNKQELFDAKNRPIWYKNWRILLFYLTNRGLYCPDFLFKKRNTSLDFCPNLLSFRLVKEVKVYNLLAHKYQLRKFERKKIIELKKEFNYLYKEVNKKYNELEKSYKVAFEEFKTKEHWENYLNLSSK